ncbi:DUF416 family protein [Alteromonadaceae bacterium M269]|nr:DUF416 family protein [Alteromonadaceae bacterium M269]
MQNKLNLFQQVRELKGWQAVAYAATLVERMLPNYQLFCEVTEFSDGKQFRNTLNGIWEWLTVPKAKINFDVQAEKVEQDTPDPDNFDHFGVYPALDVAMSITAIIALIQEQDLQGAVVVSKLSQGSVEAFIDATKESEEELSNQEIRQHPLMQWELEFQQELLEAVSESKSKPEKVKELRAMAKAEGISNIGIEIA